MIKSMTNQDINLLKETKELFQNAISLYDYRHRIEIMMDSDQSGCHIAAQDYRDGIPLLNTMITNNKFVTWDDHTSVRDAIVAYRKSIPDDHKLTARRIDRYLAYLDSNKTCELAGA
jgi:hypothetical protein